MMCRGPTGQIGEGAPRERSASRPRLALAAGFALTTLVACAADAGSAPSSMGAAGSAGTAASIQAGATGEQPPSSEETMSPGLGGGAGGSFAANEGGATILGGTSSGGAGAAGGLAAPAPGTADDVAVLDCDPARTLAPGDHSFTISSANGLTYEYTIVVPESLTPGTKAPLALVWHALWSSPEETRSLTHVDETMAELGAVSVHPRSPDQSWDVGSCCTNVVLGQRRDETVFVRELLDDIASKVCIDPQRIYTSGFSNGGMMSQMLACEMADVFAAAAPMGSTLTIPPSECQPSRPVPILLINGTADPLVSYSAPGLAGGISVPDAFHTWAERNGCVGEPETTVQQGKATCQTYRDCNGGAEVALCSVDGMGHCVPGMKTESPMNCLTKNLIPLGMPNDDIDGVEMSAEFVAGFALP